MLVSISNNLADELLTKSQEDGFVIKRCSTRFLLSLALELLRARAFVYVQITQPEISTLKHAERCHFLELEVARLLQYPSLFPSAIERARFLALLALDSELCFTAACKDLLVEQELDKWHSSWRSRCRPNFIVGSKDWENFLCKDAPGLGTSLKATTPKSYLQVVPGVAMSILDVAGELQERIRTFIRNVGHCC